MRVFITWLCLFVMEPLLGGSVVPFTVFGVITGTSSRPGVALVKTRQGGKILAVKERSSIEDGWNLSKVMAKKVILERDGASFQLMIGEHDAETLTTVAKPALATHVELNEGVFRVDRSVRDQLISKDLGKVLMQAGTEPVVENGKLVGFRLFDIDQGSIYELAGFTEGDVITQVAGMPLTDAAMAMKLLNTMKNEIDTIEETDITFRRGDQLKNLTVKF